jgi:hypothetical protein
MKAMEWLAVVAVPLLILLLGVLVVRKLSISHREASIPPLSVGELQRREASVISSCSRKMGGEQGEPPCGRLFLF